MATVTADWRVQREVKLEALHERLAGAVEALVSGEDWMRAMAFAAQFRSRSFNNTLLIYVQHAEAFKQGRVSERLPTYVAGFKQWEQLGRVVQRGQKGYMIQAPVTARWASANPSDSFSWRRLGFREPAAPGEVVRTRIVQVKPAYVWDVSQTEGDPIPERPMPMLLEGEAPEGLWDGLAGLVAADGYELLRATDASSISGANGVTNYTDSTVSVRLDMDDAAQVKTLIHELAHVRMHHPDDRGLSHHRGIGEVEAESVAMMVGAAHGMSTDGYTIPYVSGWATTVEGKNPLEVVQATGERVRATASRILDALDTTQTGGGDPPGLTRTPSVNRSRHPELSGVQAPPMAGQVMAVSA